MHTEASWHQDDVGDGLQPVRNSNRPGSTSQPITGGGASELPTVDENHHSLGRAVAGVVAPLAQPTMRQGTGEYDALLSRVLKQAGDSGSAGFIGFTGCHRRSGVSTISANVAIRAADQNNGSVLLVEANILYPRQLQYFGLIGKPGLFEVLGSGFALDQGISQTRIPNLSVLGSGNARTHTPPVIMQDALDGFVQELRERFSLVIFDLPSNDSLSNWAPLVRHLDSLLLVIASEETTQGDLLRVQNQCMLDNLQITGSILNRYQSYVPKFLRRRS
jgi:Mrp family chromosome partitioning ATPase